MATRDDNNVETPLSPTDSVLPSQSVRQTSQGNCSSKMLGGTGGYASTVMELQASIRALVNERRELQTRLTGRGRFRSGNNLNHSSGVPLTSPNGVSNTSGKDLTGGITSFRAPDPLPPTARGLKRERAIFDENNRYGPNDNSRINNAGLRIPGPGGALDVTLNSFPVEKRPKISLDDSSIKRNRNLFGSLLGHLKKAKTRLDTEKTTKTAELQRLAEEQVSQKLDFEKRNLAELRRRDYQDRQQRDLARMKDLQKELQTKETEILSLNLQKHFNLMKNFIRTDTSPMIFWTPGTHTEKTRRLQELTQEQIQRKVESLVDKFCTTVQLDESQWNPEDDDDKMQRTYQSEISDMHYNKNNKLSSHRNGTAVSNSLAKAVATVHPDLINDSDEDDDENISMTPNAELSNLNVPTHNDMSVYSVGKDRANSQEQEWDDIPIPPTECSPDNVNPASDSQLPECCHNQMDTAAKPNKTLEEQLPSTADVSDGKNVQHNNSQNEVTDGVLCPNNSTNSDCTQTNNNVTADQVTNMLVKELQHELKLRGLSAVGKKDELVDRLLENLAHTATQNASQEKLEQ